ncbi:uncharacterized protein FOMMEDRAFT_77644 [Fomitiporia mediterranea MF3/22]|uniref:uncharacterized protein n=1 Tax=Fomitiporia mediterranea (strain MF3/22) TaxID=694068 RepID=UPI0004409512|nr:uncharacterized protein FOMMEDRAFT_77644 [Fomitiporia mediterranea MF3/22]EJD05826.1 hypothetical protein FOMMEDRAFT_77644 [Fomitiporia mediterranea MF3/22]
MSAKSLLATVLHGLGAAIMTWGYLSLKTTVMHTLIKDQKSGHSQFLTVQALLISLITMALSLARDILPVNLCKTLLMYAKRALFLIALPLSVVVTSIYWTLIVFFPTLILRRAPEPSEPSAEGFDDLLRIPLSLDLALHAAPAITLLLDFFLFERSYGPRAANLGATVVSAVFSVWYAVWVEYCASFNGVFPYPFLTENTFPIRAVIYIVVTAIAFLSFHAINTVHKVLTGRYTPIKEKST